MKFAFLVWLQLPSVYVSYLSSSMMSSYQQRDVIMWVFVLASYSLPSYVLPASLCASLLLPLLIKFMHFFLEAFYSLRYFGTKTSLIIFLNFFMQDMKISIQLFHFCCAILRDTNQFITYKEFFS